MGIQIALTGLVFLASGLAHRQLNNYPQGDWLDLMEVLMILGGLAAVMIGSLMKIWS